ncbi:MAG: hypothetical protein AAB634_03305, partial [Patescibacteria group bacterium]
MWLICAKRYSRFTLEEVVTHAVPFQYWPVGQEVFVEEVTQEEPFQYWPEGHVVEELLTQALPLQYWPVGQSVVEVFTHAVP